MSDNTAHIQQIAFGDGHIEIVYSEPRDVENMDATGVLRTRMVQCPASLAEDEVSDLVDSAQQLLDKILLHERNAALRR